VVLIADHIVHSDCMRQYPNLVRIPGIVVDAVVWWPYSAWPQGSPGVHDIDEVHMKLMNQWLATEEGTAQYLEKFVFGYANLDEYLALIGADVIGKIDKGPTNFLLDPYRQWIQPRNVIQALLAQSSHSGSTA
jgi:glutaconate CoA-transferase subunit A